MNHTWLSTAALLGRCKRAYIQVAKLAGWVLVPAAAIMLASASGFAAEPLGDKPKYICPPCYHVTDILETEDYLHHGNCPVCGMRLIEKHQKKAISPVAIHAGSGNFYIERTDGDLISVFYHRPKGFTADSRILLVIPGAGRNAWSYRDNWVGHSEKYNVLILSPTYPEQDYDFAAYHMGGILSSLTLTNFTTSKYGNRVSKYFVEDGDIAKGEATISEAWIFSDFDRIFDVAAAAVNSSQQGYDIFGHSAGGQILSRMAVFNPGSKARRIIAANAGSYTLPSLEFDFPVGLGLTNFDKSSIHQVFSADLTVLVGEKDNDAEHRGTMLHTPLLDKQGLGRLSRGKYFYQASLQQARDIDAEFNWKMSVVENVGHDNRIMGEAAAKLLYE